MRGNDLIFEYYQEVKHLYPDLDENTFREICVSPWKFLKTEMEKDTLYDIRFKYLGCFQVYPGRAKIMLNWNKKRLDSNLITELEHDRYKTMIEKHLNRLDNESKDNS